MTLRQEILLDSLKSQKKTKRVELGTYNPKCDHDIPLWAATLAAIDEIDRSKNWKKI